MTRYLLVLASCFVAFSAQAEDKIVHIYQDADLSNHIESSRAIQKGIEVAFAEVDNMIDGYEVAFKYLDHRGNVVRSKRNNDAFLADPHALVMYSGIHSPPLIKNRDYINENGILTLVPWAAGGPITRHPSSENWVYRLSVDDTRAGAVIVDFALDQKGCTSPHLLLEDTPWGNSNLKSMSQALEARKMQATNVTRFGWNLGDQSARILLRNIEKSGHDCIILVGNAIEGTVIARALLDVNPSIPLISHWGITGGKFHEAIPHARRQEMDLSFIQSCFAFTNPTQNPLAQRVFHALSAHTNGAIKTPHDLKSAVGFIHAYDLTKIFIAAVEQAGLTGDMTRDRDAIRRALEDIKTPVAGLVKTYTAPFSAFDAASNPNAHEALHEDSYCMARYGAHDEIVIVGAE